MLPERRPFAFNRCETRPQPASLLASLDVTSRPITVFVPESASGVRRIAEGGWSRTIHSARETCHVSSGLRGYLADAISHMSASPSQTWHTDQTGSLLTGASWQQCLIHYAQTLAIDPDLFHAIVPTESAGHPGPWAGPTKLGDDIVMLHVARGCVGAMSSSSPDRSQC